MPGFDWNGNGKSDAFDHFMDMKAMSSTSDASGKSSSEVVIDDTDNEEVDALDVTRTELIGTLRKVSEHKDSGTPSAVSFQDELRQNMRSPEVVKRENAERESNARMTEAKLTLHEIKRALVQSAKDARYTTQNGVTTVSCLCRLPQRFMRRRNENNGEQLRQNQQKFVLLRDPDLIYRTWVSFDIEPKYSSEYYQYVAALRQIAAAENISVEIVVQDAKENKVYPFPTKIPSVYTVYWYLCVRASTVVFSDDANNIKQPKTTVTPEVPRTIYESTPANQNTEQSTNQNSQQSNSAVIGKSLLAIGLVVGAFALCLSGEMGQLGMGLLLIGAAIAGYFILKK